MRWLWLSLFATSAGCAGISIGETSADAADSPRCRDQHEEPVTDTTKLPHGFERSPEELLEPVTGQWQGTLILADGLALEQSVPVTIEITLDDSSIRAVYADDPNTTCEPWLTADVTLAIDAGATLSGTAKGSLSTRVDPQIRADWVDFADFQSTLVVPDFSADIISGPALLLDFLFGADGRWHGEWQFAAQVATKPCDEQTETCAGGSGDFTPEYHALGQLVLERVEAP